MRFKIGDKARITHADCRTINAVAEICDRKN